MSATSRSRHLSAGHMVGPECRYPLGLETNSLVQVLEGHIVNRQFSRVSVVPASHPPRRYRRFRKAGFSEEGAILRPLSGTCSAVSAAAFFQWSSQRFEKRYLSSLTGAANHPIRHNEISVRFRRVKAVVPKSILDYFFERWWYPGRAEGCPFRRGQLVGSQSVFRLMRRPPRLVIHPSHELKSSKRPRRGDLTSAIFQTTPAAAAGCTKLVAVAPVVQASQ